MPARVVQTGDEPVVLRAGDPHFLPVSIFVKANAGSVTIEQFDEETETYFLPADAENNLSADANVEIDRSNKPGLRITALGGATFTFFGDEI